MKTPEPNYFRILVADDEQACVDLFRQVLSLTGDSMSFDLVSCDTKDLAVNIVKKSVQQNNPFSVAFIDIPMPFGTDGWWAAEQIRAIDPHVEIVLMTAYLDYTPQEITSHVPPVHKLIYIQKPFHSNEIYHYAHALCSKWQLELNWLNANKKLERLVEERTKKLVDTNEQLVAKAFEYKQTADSLKESEKKYRRLFTNESEAFLVIDAETYRFEDVNPAALDLFEFSKEEFKGLTARDISAEKDKTRIELQKIRRNEPGSNYIPLRYFKKKDGTVFPGEVYAGTFISKGRNKLIGAIRDITERKRDEERLRFLSANLLTAQEKERKKIALELHDDFGQILSALKLNLRYIQKRLKNRENLKSDCENAVLIVNQVIEKVRRLSHGLTPCTLDDLGLSTGLKVLIRDFSKHTELTILYEFNDMDNLFSSMSQLLIYRIFQEALMNIHHHSQADQVTIHAKKRENDISFMIEDNGKGFDVKQLASSDISKSGLGITSMKERVRLLDGQIEINSQLSHGTQIVFTIPFERE